MVAPARSDALPITCANRQSPTADARRCAAMLVRMRYAGGQTIGRQTAPIGSTLRAARRPMRSRANPVRPTRVLRKLWER